MVCGVLGKSQTGCSCILFVVGVLPSTHEQSWEIEPTNRQILYCYPIDVSIQSRQGCVREERSIFISTAGLNSQKGLGAENIRGKTPTASRPPNLTSLHQHTLPTRSCDRTRQHVLYLTSTSGMAPLMVIPDHSDEDQPDFCSNS